MAQHTAVRIPMWAQSLTLALLAAISSVPGFRNQWVQDDLPIITKSPTLHSLAQPWTFFTQAWWPDPYPRELYRPLTSTLLAFQWVLGHGSPMLFRFGSYLLYIAATLAVFALARRLASATAAWLAAALFAVHPVHVEAVAVAVNQAEIVVALLSILLFLAYLKRRESGDPLTWRWMLGMTAGYAAASLFKESGAMIPALFVAAELTVIRDERPWGERIAALRPLYLLLVLAAVVIVEARSLALAGNTLGTFTAEGLVGLDMKGRAITMLGVVPIWARLLLWPRHLQADYSPQEIVGTTVWGLPQTAGALILLGVLLAAWFNRRRNPVVVLMVLWLGIALFPVSNVLVPTGIVVAERTLFGASVAVVVLLGIALAPLVTRLLSISPVARIMTATAIAVLLGAGVARSAARQLVWYDVTKLWFQSLSDAPLSYRVHHTWGEIMFNAGDQRTGVYHYRRAIELRPTAWPVYFELAEKYRDIGQCPSAIRLYGELLKLAPSHAGGRASLVACLVHQGEYRAALGQARIGIAWGVQVGSFRRYAQIADSAMAVAAPPGSVTLPPPSDTLKTR